MDPRSPCPSCRALNKESAEFCSQCFSRLNARRALATQAWQIPAAAARQNSPAVYAAPPSRPVAASATIMPSVERPVELPAATFAPATTFAPLPPSNGHRPQLQAGPVDQIVHTQAVVVTQPNFVPYKEPERRRKSIWRWWQLALFWACAWIVPTWFFGGFMFLGFSTSQALAAELTFQVFGYVLAACVGVWLVNHWQKGDWSTLGLSGGVEWRDVARGSGFGLLIVGVMLPIGILAEGRLSFDTLIHMYIGKTTIGGLILAAFVIVLGAPVVEETFYRGMVYDWFGRWGRIVAIAGSTVMFTIAHGALLIPAILLMGVALGYKRKKESIFYTMGAHATWNFVIVCLAAFMLLDPPKTFEPDDHSYSFKYSATWHRSYDLEGPKEGDSLDLALEDPSGAAIDAARLSVPAGDPQNVLPQLLLAIHPPKPGETPNAPKPVPAPAGMASAFEMNVPIVEEGIPGRRRFFATMKAGSTTAFLLTLSCDVEVCAEVTADFDLMVLSLKG